MAAVVAWIPVVATTSNLVAWALWLGVGSRVARYRSFDQRRLNLLFRASHLRDSELENAVRAARWSRTLDALERRIRDVENEEALLNGIKTG